MPDYQNPNPYPFTVMMQSRPKPSGVHPLIVMLVVALIILVIGALYYFLGSFISPFTSGIQSAIGSNTPANFTTANSILTSAEKTTDIGFVVIVVFALFLNAFVAWMRPSKILGFLDILLLFFIGYIYLMIRIPFIQIAPALGIVKVLPVLYAFFVSNYYIGITAAMMVIATIFNFTGE